MGYKYTTVSDGFRGNAGICRDLVHLGPPGPDRTKNINAATNAASAAKGDRVGAGADLAASVKLEVQLKRTMDPIVRSTYAGNVAKLAAWASAYHVEKAPTKKDPPPPPPAP
ncbi:MAG: hypothetical protein WBC19_04220 [Pyrinomonadaceae bacterium]